VRPVNALITSKVCDGVNNCGGWQDEPVRGCGVDECAANNGGCDQVAIFIVSAFFVST
jgi:hypothetical protein